MDNTQHWHIQSGTYVLSSTPDNEKEFLLNKINEKKAQFASSRKGTESWSSSGAKKPGVSQVSKLAVQSLEKEIKSLSEELRILQNK